MTEKGTERWEGTLTSSGLLLGFVPQGDLRGEQRRGGEEEGRSSQCQQQQTT